MLMFMPMLMRPIAMWPRLLWFGMPEMFISISLLVPSLRFSLRLRLRCCLIAVRAWMMLHRLVMTVMVAMLLAISLFPRVGLTFRFGSCRAGLNRCGITWRVRVLGLWLGVIIMIMVMFVMLGTLVTVIASRISACDSVVCAGEDFVVLTPCFICVLALARSLFRSPKLAYRGHRTNFQHRASSQHTPYAY